jgi:hypothetical protein
MTLRRAHCVACWRLTGAPPVKVFKRAEETMPPANPPAPPSIAEIASRARQGAELQLGQKRLATLRGRHREIFEEIRGAIRRREAAGAEHEIARINRGEIAPLQRESKEVEAEIRALRVTLAPLRTEYARRLTEVLAPSMREDAAAALIALSEFRARLLRLRESDETIGAAGSSSGGWPIWHMPPGIGEIEAALRRTVEIGAKT